MLHRSFCLSSLLLCLLAGPMPTFANGNYSHVWMTTEALDHVPDGDLRDLLTRPELLLMLQNGAMFPDGGYAIGSPHAEVTHWEPFQLAYLEWILSHYQPPWSDEAAQHIAFLMGIAAHGISDQLYDGLYLERHEVYDEKPAEEPLFGVDGVTDACFAATQDFLEPPAKWLPAEDLAPLYSQFGLTIDAATLDSGQSLVVVAVIAANGAAADPEQMAKNMSLYPWACAHQDDPLVPGSPVNHGATIAAFWQVLWARLHGQAPWESPLLGTYFAGGSPWDHPVESTTPEGWVSFALPFGLSPGTVTAETVAVTDAGGAALPANPWVYYGSDSHLVNIVPQEDWPADEEFTVTITPPITSWDGHELATTHTFTFATRPAPEPVEPDVVEPDSTEPDVVTQPESAPDSAAPEHDGVDVVGPVDAGPVESATGGGCNAGVPAGPMAPVLLLLLLSGLLVRRGYGCSTWTRPSPSNESGP